MNPTAVAAMPDEGRTRIKNDAGITGIVNRVLDPSYIRRRRRNKRVRTGAVGSASATVTTAPRATSI